VDFIQQSKAFDEISVGNLTPNAIAIYYHLFHVNNRTGWKEWFTQSDYWIGQAVGIRRSETIFAALNLLKQKGLIDFVRGTKRNQPTKYKIMPLDMVLKNSTKTDENIVQKPTKNRREPSAKTDENIGAILNNKHKQEPKPRQVNNVSARAKFVPPTLEEVNEYVMERGLHVVAKDFYDYFTVGEWKDKNGVPVRNWKQKILTWEKFQTKEKLSTKPQSSTQDDIDSAIEFFRRREEEENDEGRSDFAGY